VRFFRLFPPSFMKSFVLLGFKGGIRSIISDEF